MRRKSHAPFGLGPLEKDPSSRAPRRRPTSALRFTSDRRTPVEEYDGRQFVGIDLHRRRSVIVRMTPEGQRLGPAKRIVNDAGELAAQVASWGESPEVVLEATYGWYWAADVLAEAGANVHLAHPLGWHHDTVNTKPRRQPADGTLSTDHTLTSNDALMLTPNVAQHLPRRDRLPAVRPNHQK